MSIFRNRALLLRRALSTRRGNALLALLALLALVPGVVLAQATLPALTTTPGPNGTETYSLSIQTLIMLTSLSFLPAAVLMMTGFTRIIIVLSLMRNALGTQTTPPNMVLIGLALFLTAYTMSPVFDEIYQKAYQPLTAGSITFETALERGAGPLRTFMLHQTRETDLALFANMTNQPAMDSPANVPLKVLVPAFVTSELKTAFQIGFTVFIPFLIIDMVVASVLMGLGMMMVPPVTVSLPFKLMLFVLADGWHLLLGSLSRSFYQ
ncbi:flagellar type III secretion system pore protein FliP [Bordetella sp. LUAb4]|uniref:flagellar type III secretion system pore protein FliP n=1 Tax=Bordetella sp. LUAb4 TaxID=2843195 RepID=UPI001E3A1908|nr:flagellar type III secretion system pore protein FliP [Bordetella sp. LUAb4]